MPAQTAQPLFSRSPAQISQQVGGVMKGLVTSSVKNKVPVPAA